MADAPAAPAAATATSAFDRDTAVSLRSRELDGVAQRVRFAAEVSSDWRAGRGPHGGYLAAMLLRALTDAVADAERAARSLTIHYARAPQPGPVTIDVAIERQGRSLSTLSARMEQDGALVALALSAFSVAWSAPQIAELALPQVDPPDAERKTGIPLFAGAPPFTRHLIVQPRIGAVPFQGSDAPMEVGSWLGLLEERPIDALSLAFFSDALFSPPFIRLREPSTTPTVDLTIHFRTPMPRSAEPDAGELCFARFRSGLIQEGFFEEDGVIWAADGTVLAQSRQLGIVLPLPIG
ncbi:MAG TPA: thioesterase family protein [Solirubrobacteraceae bacterium]|nr:thioesterase family protein [Solirubrobacteraceae bacterium]